MRMTSVSNWRHLNRPATEGARTISDQLVRPLLQSCNTSLTEVRNEPFRKWIRARALPDFRRICTRTRIALTNGTRHRWPACRSKADPKSTSATNRYRQAGPGKLGWHEGFGVSLLWNALRRVIWFFIFHQMARFAFRWKGRSFKTSEIAIGYE
jgi:hypothetical protein